MDDIINDEISDEHISDDDEAVTRSSGGIDDKSNDKVRKKEKLKRLRNEFIDDEAELSGDDEVSEDELELSDDDGMDPDLVDQDAKELDDEEEEEVRRLYHKQLLSEDKRAVLLLQEQLEDKDVAIGERRRKKFRWQTREIMGDSLGRHYNPDEDDSQGGDDSDDDFDDDYDYTQPKHLRRPTTEALLLGSTKFITRRLDNTQATQVEEPQASSNRLAASVAGDDSNSNTASLSMAGASVGNNLNRFLFRDKETVQALSTKEVVVVSKEDKEKNIQREIKRMLQSKSVFDQLYS